MKKRVFNICQYFKNPRTGEVLIDDEAFEQIKTALYKYKSLKKWAWAVHDHDIYMQEDEDNNIYHLTEEYHEAHKNEPMTEEYSVGLAAYIKENQWVFAGKPKPKHIHIVISTGKTNLDVTLISKWLGLPQNTIDYPYGSGAFLDCVKYLTHEDETQQEKGKYLYDDDVINANFEWREELNKRDEDILRYGGANLTTKDKFRYEVLYNGMTLKMCEELDRINYMDDLTILKKYRLEYIAGLNPPKTRLNFYVCGRGGVGKGLMSRAIARAMFPNLEHDEDIFFNVGAGQVAFEGYDGQPVIIWNDFRAGELLKALGGRGNVFTVFDTHPTKQRQNVKFGSVNLCNVVNIVNSVDNYTKFLDDMAGEYTANGVEHKAEDKGQAKRRFPMIIPLHEEDFDILLNKGFLENTNDFEEYIQYTHIRGNLQKIAVACGQNEALARQIESMTVKPITDKYDDILQAAEREVDEQAIMEMFKDYGKPVEEKKEEESLPGQMTFDDGFMHLPE